MFLTACFHMLCAVLPSLPSRLEQMDKDDDSGATATAIFLRNDVLVVSHIGDSCLVLTFLFTCLGHPVGMPSNWKQDSASVGSVKLTFLVMMIR